MSYANAGVVCVQDGHNSEDSKQSTAGAESSSTNGEFILLDFVVGIVSLLLTNSLLQQSSVTAKYGTSTVYLTSKALDEMGNRINELEQSINDLKVELGVEGSPSPLPPPNQMPDEARQEKGSA
ncbi:hypothetical protein V6N13_020577 [Hibiscus sabdariffa]|uniref:Uncharacterized protein n=1 Tax=Hibiscus sabdariffa TaxID=183260 RepID=A0ABR2ETW2_9ROSI